MNRFPILLLFVALIAVSGCSSIRGERVGTDFGSSVDLSATQAPTDDPLDTEASLATGHAQARHMSEPDPVDLGQRDATASFDFQAQELYSGAVVEGSELFGQGKVLVTFVQPGCEITIGGGTTIAEVAEQHPEAIFVIVHSGGDDEAYRAFAEEAMLFQENMMHLSDTFGSLAERYTIDAYPTTLLIDADLRISAVTGVMDHESQQQAVESVTTGVISS